MSCSKNNTFGRKVVKSKKDQVFRWVMKTWTICLVVGCVIGSIITWGITALSKDEVTEEQIEIIETTLSNVIEEAFLTNAAIINSEEVPEEVLEKVLEGVPENMTEETTEPAGDGFIPLDVPMNEFLQKHIYHLSLENELEFALVMALIKHESSFKPNVISESNDYGLMQINQINHEWLTNELGVTNYLDPYENTKAGVFILKGLFDKYETPEKVLMAYNLGESGASALWDEGVFETTYTNKILESAAEYEQQISERGEK